MNYNTECDIFYDEACSVEGSARIFESKWFARFARQQGIEDQDLCEAVERAARGVVDADRGGGVLKQRIARPNEGKSGGFRVVILFRVAERACFVYGFLKSERSNIRPDEIRAFKELAAQILGYSDEQLQTAIDSMALTEVICDEENV